MAEKLYGLIGRKLGHSYSAPIHAAMGNGAYRLFELESEELREFLSRPDIGGLNVTIPYKRDVMKYCDVISPDAESVGSVNTIVRRADGRLYAYNTDVYGFMYMAARAGISLAGKKVVILGSGGAYLAVRAAAEKAGARQIVCISRSGEDNYENIGKHADAQVIVNATPVGMYPNNGASPVDLSIFKSCEGVLDLIYNPARTALIMQARALGIPCSGGLFMLVAQAKAAEEYFFDKKFDDAVIGDITAKLSRESENIVIIGMPGSGKTTIGEALERLTGRRSVDTDALIEARAGISIPEIFARFGEAEFRRMEREAVAEAGRGSGTIIMTGGGAVKDERNLAPLRGNGRIYHIERDIELLSRDGRPLSQGADLYKMYAERLPMYERFCDVSIRNDASPEDAAERIWRDFCENTCDKRA
ncbi:MAG: shikimate kinase [Clostridia bacterium]|nr:shikimate kinase [Clostridia bacterium]